MKRSYSMKNNQASIEYIAVTDWSEIYNVTSTEIAFDAICNKLTNLLKKMFPHCAHQLSIIINCIIATKKMHSVKSDLPDKINSNIKGNRKKHYQDLLRKYKDNMKKSWGITKRLIIRINCNRLKQNLNCKMAESLMIILIYLNISMIISPTLGQIWPNVYQKLILIS